MHDVIVPYGARPACETCGAATEILWTSSFPNIIGDECDFVAENLAQEPIRFTSKSAHRDRVKAQGLYIKERHLGSPGSDKSKFTTRWT
jgi:hypothetical protein